MKKFIISSILILVSALHAKAQQAAATNSTMIQNRFVSVTDSNLTIKTIGVAKVTDNLQGIYSEAVENRLKQYLSNDPQWTLKEIKGNLSIEEWDQPQKVSALGLSEQVDAIIQTHLIKGPRGLQISMNLYSSKDGQPLASDELRDSSIFETKAVAGEAQSLLEKLRRRIPYEGLVISRRGQQVTLNMGQNQGLKNNDELTVIQILSTQRHPKLKFIISTEKEVLGKIRLFKVEPTLSFGYVVAEKEVGVVQVNNKIQSQNFVTYTNPATDPEGKLLSDLSARQDKDVAFGDKPSEWSPESDPQFGKVGFYFGMGPYNQNTTLKTLGSFDGESAAAPHLKLVGELWLDQNWQIGAKIRQSVFTIDNGLSSSSPKSLNASINQYGIKGLYNFLLSNEFFGPKWQIGVGFENTKFEVDQSSPLAYSSMNYSGMYLALGGQFPVSDEIPLLLGAEYDFYLSKSASENKPSGGGSHTVNTFSVYGDYRFKSRWSFHTELAFEYYSSNFSATVSIDRPYPASQTSHKVTTIFVGLDYMF